MEIVELAAVDGDAFQAFKRREWAIADQAHFGDVDLDFEKHPFTLVAHEADAFAGYVTATLDMGALYIDALLVGAAFQRHGIGRRLMAACEERGKAMGAHKAWLETGATWDARFLYERLGYTRVAELKNHYAGQDYLIYEKFL